MTDRPINRLARQVSRKRKMCVWFDLVRFDFSSFWFFFSKFLEMLLLSLRLFRLPIRYKKKNLFFFFFPSFRFHSLLHKELFTYTHNMALWSISIARERESFSLTRPSGPGWWSIQRKNPVYRVKTGEKEKKSVGIFIHSLTFSLSLSLFSHLLSNDQCLQMKRKKRCLEITEKNITYNDKGAVKIFYFLIQLSFHFTRKTTRQNTFLNDCPKKDKSFRKLK